MTGAAEDTPAAARIKIGPIEASRGVPNFERLRSPVIYTCPPGRKIRKPEPERESRMPAGATGLLDFEFPKGVSSSGTGSF